MSEQQFTIESERISTTYSVRILKDDEVIFEISNWDSLGEMHKTECEDIVALLNELSEENEKLKKEKKDSEEDVTDYHNALFDLHKKFDKLEKENEELRQTNEKLRWDLEKTRKDLDFFANLKVTAMKGYEPMDETTNLEHQTWTGGKDE